MKTDSNSMRAIIAYHLIEAAKALLQECETVHSTTPPELKRHDVSMDLYSAAIGVMRYRQDKTAWQNLENAVHRFAASQMEIQ